MSLWAITGGSGFVGRHLIRRLAAEGHGLRSLDLEPLDLPGVEALTGDVRSTADARALCAGADVLVHAAAALPIRGDLRSVNVGGTATVIAAATEAGVRTVIFISSAVVHGLGRGPIEPYGRTKLEAERIARAAGAIVLRPTAIVGPERLGLHAILYDWIREGRRVYTLGAGRNRYQLLAVEDLIEAIVLAAERAPAGVAFDLGATRVGTVREDLEGLIRHAGSASRVVALPERPARAALAALAAARLSPLSAWHYRSAGRDVVLDVREAEAELGWAPRRSNGEALAAAYDWYLAHRGAATGTTHRVAWGQGALGLVRRLS